MLQVIHWAYHWTSLLQAPSGACSGPATWRASDEYDNLFALDDTWFLSRQTYLFPCFVAGMDYLCHLRATQAVDEAILEFASSPGGSPRDSLTVYRSSPIELPGSFHFGDINDAASCRPFPFYDDALLISFDDGSGGSDIYASTWHVNFYGGVGISVTLDDDTLRTSKTDQSPFLTETRACWVRQQYRVPVLWNPREYQSEIVLAISDIPVENSNDNFEDFHVALDTMFVYGIDSTSRENCLMHNLRCEGRRQDGQLTFYPSPDTLLYLMSTSLVHGCRGVHLRALDLTIRCGNGGGDAPSGTYRCPDLMLNWGPSVETTNPDMIGRMLDVVQSMTGKNTSNPDFMSALIDSSFAIMDTASVRNAVYSGSGWTQDLDNDSLNFIALEDTVSGDILLMAVNDFDEMFYDNEYIRFPDHYEDSYTVHFVDGFQCGGDTLRDETRVRFNFYGMPGYTASLYWLEYD